MIKTQHVAPTKNKVARVKVTSPWGNLEVPWNDNVDGYTNHLSAAKLVAGNIGWTRLAFGDTPDGNYYIWVNGSITEHI